MTNKVFSILKEYGLLAGDKKVIDFLSQLDEDEIRKILLKVKKKNVMVIKLEHVKMFKETTEITIEKKENKISISKKNTTSILQFIQIKEESKEIKETKKEEEVEIIHTTKKPEDVDTSIEIIKPIEAKAKNGQSKILLISIKTN